MFSGEQSPTSRTCRVLLFAFVAAIPGLLLTAHASSAFSDDPLVPQSSVVKTAHIVELRAAIDSLRVARGLATFAWTDPTLVPGSTPVTVVHLTELRTALNQVYQAAGWTLPTYTDPTLVARLTVIKAIHLDELRTAATVANDTRPPLVSGVTASAITSSGATITWTTDEVSDSQVEYGLTTTYSSSTPVTASLVTSHLVTLSGLAGTQLYHFRVRSHDAAGNLATSTDFTFTTLDGTPPSVSITTPTAGAIVAGTVTVAATATDNVGVIGVQFKLDGANLGPEDTTAPYSISWNTTAATQGSHTLTAVARDAAGNQAISSVTVTVGPPPPPPPAGGIAARYPGDVGIETDPDVIFVEQFEDALLTDLFSRWTDILNGSAMSLSSDVPPGSPGARSLTIPWVGGGVSNGGHLYKLLLPGVDDTLYVRYYIKYPTSGTYQHSGIWIGGYNPPLAWPNPQAGIKPTGSDRLSASGEQNPLTSRFDHYDYWMTMRQSADGNYWGNLLLNAPNVQAKTGQWMCVEQMVKLNNPVTSFNGEHAIWLDGVKVSHLGQGFPNGSWSGGIFTQEPSGSTFEGFRWRSDSSLNLNWIWLQVYASTDPAGFSSSIRFDHVVAARSYIGCLASGTPDTTPPAVSITAPAAAATVAGPITVAATATDNVGVVGVQFKLDGTNLGPEDTTAPYSISWNTSGVANGSHALTAVARDAAGNTTTSADVTVTVSNVAPPPSFGWPNEPAGLTVLTDWGFDQDVPTGFPLDVTILGSPGWRVVYEVSPGTAHGYAQHVSDPGAPFSPSNVYDFVYPQGMVEGNAPATVYYNLSASEVYAGFWWKPSSPFDLGPNGNKIAFLFNGGGGAGGQQFLILRPDGRLHVLPEYPGDYRWRAPNVNATLVTLGVWHRVEWYASKAGTLKWWLDGVLQGSYSDAGNSYNFDIFEFSPTWGGNVGAQKHQTDHYWFDHVHLSTR